MKRTSYFVGSLLMLFFALTSIGWGQTCPGGGSATNNWCGSYTAYDPNCRSGLSTGSCSVTNNIGFVSKTGGPTGHPSITAPYIDQVYSLGTAGPDVVPNAAIGKNQYVEFANNRVQGYDRSTGVPIFIDDATHQNFRPSSPTPPGILTKV